MITILVAITLVGVISFITLAKYTGNEASAEPSIDEILALSVDINEITTNLLSNDFIRIQFKIQTDNKKAKEELEKREFQVRNIILQDLSEMSSDDFNGKLGITDLESRVKMRVNEILQEGTVVRVYITSFILQ